jgi:hypothetical protein
LEDEIHFHFLHHDGCGSIQSFKASLLFIGISCAYYLPLLTKAGGFDGTTKWMWKKIDVIADTGRILLP